MIEDFVSNDDIGDFQSRDRKLEIIRGFNETKHLIAPKYRNMFSDNIIGSEIVHLGKHYTIVTNYDGKMVAVSANGRHVIVDDVVPHEKIDIPDQLLCGIYKNILSVIDMHMYDRITLFTSIADVFDIEYSKLYELMPYSHGTELKNILIKKTGIIEQEPSVW